MKNFLIILGLILRAVSFSHAEPPPIKFTGKSTVEGLGTIVLPAGDWSLEFRRVEPDVNLDMPNYFVFKRLGDRLERLTFLRYGPISGGLAPASLLDTIGETMGDGIPYDQKKHRPPSSDEEMIFPMKYNSDPPKPTAKCVYFSFIHTHVSPEPAWLCHTVLFVHQNAVFIIAHASTSVTSPEAVRDVYFDSKFSPNAMSAPMPK